MRGKAFIFSTAAVFAWTLCLGSVAMAQDNGDRGYRDQGYRDEGYQHSEKIDAGTTIPIRTTASIDSRHADGRVYPAIVDRDVRSRDGDIVIPRGSDAELVVRQIADNDYALDLDAVTIHGVRYGIRADSDEVEGTQGANVGANKQTGEYVGGGALLGAIIGGIAGGGKGAAIGAGAGAAAGAGAEIATHGDRIAIPSESLLTFELRRPMRAGVVDSGYMRDGVHYHHEDAYNGNTRNDVRNNDERQKPADTWSITLQANNNVAWTGPMGASLYVQQDDQAPKLFASGQNGVQAAPWMNRGHRYTFILKDANGNEIHRSVKDLR